MKRRSIQRALAAGAIACVLLLVSGCSTPQTRISERPQVYQSLTATDQALVSQGKIREGMSKDAVYIAWGAPNQRAEGRNRGRAVETWIYFSTTSGDYYPGSYGYGYGFGIGGRFGYLHGGGGYRNHYYGRFFYDPFYDPFFWSRNSVVSYPDRTVSFENGRLVAFQFLPAPRVY